MKNFRDELIGFLMLLLTFVLSLDLVQAQQFGGNQNQRPVNIAPGAPGVRPIGPGPVNANQEAVPATELIALGQQLFFDDNLSNPAGQSCATCHNPSAAFSDPDLLSATSEGAVPGRFGKRNTPTLTYSRFIPPFSIDRNRRGFRGGLFLDGRVDNFKQQAVQPLLSPVEMNNESIESVVDKVSQANYAEEFKLQFGEDVFSDPAQAFENITQALAAFESSMVFAPFSSKFDAFMRSEEQLNQTERRGMMVFFGRGQCSRCHAGTDRDGRVIFSDFGYENIGVPANPFNPFYFNDPEFNVDGENFVDLGLGAVLDMPSQNGKFRTPTLRNVELTAPYMHNGVFNTLEEVVEFYNSRDLEDALLPPEVAENLTGRGRIGRLNLSQRDKDDLVSFMLTLTDR